MINYKNLNSDSPIAIPRLAELASRLSIMNISANLKPKSERLV
jgi:hypothetical protein